MPDLLRIDGFDWDERNIDKNWEKHRVTNYECEELFFNLPLLLADDKKHSNEENRYYALGRSNTDRLLVIAFMIRENKIRIISARDMNQKEEEIHAKANPKF